MRGAVSKSYEIWGRLSHGGMSDVWLARHTELALPVILKTLRGASAEPFERRYARMLEEARLTARLTSPRVVRVIDTGVYRDPADPDAEALPFLVEEYVDGLDLAEFDRRRRTALKRPLPLWAVTDQISQAAEGLHAAHQAGVIHCDVKPSNLFGYGHALIKVGDFGVAVATSDASRASPAGTPLFMSPEQLVGGRIDRRADVYALGATAFALRYGRPAFAAPVEALHAEGPPNFPAARSPEEAAFQHIVARMMAPRADARYANMLLPRHHLRAIALDTAPRTTNTREGDGAMLLGATRVAFEIGDISRVETDAIVCSSTSEMAMRSGVSSALRLRGGAEIEREAMLGGERALGECVHTGAGALACRGVLHAVGGWNEVSCVARATQRALLLAEERGYARVAMPAIATGKGGVSIEACADAMVGALRLHLALGGSRLREVRFVLYDAPTYARFTEVAHALLSGSDDSFLYDDELDAAPTGHEASSGPTLYAAGQRASLTPPRVPTERITEDDDDDGAR